MYNFDRFVLTFAGKQSCDVNGLFLINDGYQTIAALLELQKEYQSGALDGEIPENIGDLDLEIYSALRLL